MSNTQKEEVAAFYEAHHSHGKYDYLYGGEDRKEMFVQLVGTGKSVLEVGCRAGNLTQHFAKGNTVVGVDIDRTALKLFQERLGCQGHWVDVDVEPLPFPDQSFDTVVFSEVMEHVRFPQKAFGEIRRVLKPAGRLIGSVPNSFRFRNRLRFPSWGGNTRAIRRICGSIRTQFCGANWSRTSVQSRFIPSPGICSAAAARAFPFSRGCPSACGPCSRWTSSL